MLSHQKFILKYFYKDQIGLDPLSFVTKETNIQKRYF